MSQQFKQFLKRVPIPMCGLILGLASLGNLLFSLGYPILSTFYSVLSCGLMGIIVLKIIFTMAHTVKSLDDPIVASVSPTFTMSWMVICVFLNRLFPGAPLVHFIWLIAVLLHFALMIYFVVIHIFPEKIELKHVYPSWFITFVGIGVIPNTSAAFNIELGQIIIWVALFFYLILLPLILKRVFIHKQMKEATLPLITIITAPGSLCLAGYLSVVEDKSKILVILLFILSQTLYILTLYLLLKLLKLPFYPSYAAFTFPLVISATAINQTEQFLSPGHVLYVFDFFKHLEIIIALCVVSYVFVTYLRYLIKNMIKIKHQTI